MSCLKNAPTELQTTANDWKIPGDFDRQAEMSVRVWKGDSMFETL